MKLGNLYNSVLINEFKIEIFSRNTGMEVQSF